MLAGILQRGHAHRAEERTHKADAVRRLHIAFGIHIAGGDRAARRPDGGGEILPDHDVEALHIGSVRAARHHHTQNDIGLLGAVRGLVVAGQLLHPGRAGELIVVQLFQRIVGVFLVAGGFGSGRAADGAA